VLEPAADAIPVDTTGLTVDEVVEQVVFLAADGFEAQALSLRG
jgi:cytidylate kinase